jgi:hypothetical protein
VDLPQEDGDTLFTDILMRIRGHRFAHLVDALSAATDEEMMAMADDEPEKREYPPVVAEDAGYILAGVKELLKANLPRARRRQNDGLL